MHPIAFDGFILLVMGFAGRKALGVKLACILACGKLQKQAESLESQLFKPYAPARQDVAGIADERMSALDFRWIRKSG